MSFIAKGYNMSLIVIDGNSLMHRAYYALPPMSNEKGEPTNAIFGFLGMLFTLIEDYSPDHICVAFDRHEKTFRHIEYDQYKAGRRPTPDDLRPQFPLLRETLEKMGIRTVDCLGFEADDILGTLAKKASSTNMKSYLVTGDRDALQLVDDNTSIVFTKKGVKETEVFDKTHLFDVYGLDPVQITDLKGLMGDSSDNIPGVPGVGEKTALKLLHEYETVEGLYLNIDGVSSLKLRQKLIDNKDKAFFSKYLATIRTDAPLTIGLDDIVFASFDPDGTKEALSRLSFKKYLERLGIGEDKNDTVKIEKEDITSADELEKLVNESLEKKIISILDMEDELILAVTGAKDNSVIFSTSLFGDGFTRESVIGILKPALTDSSVLKIIHMSKDFMHSVVPMGVHIEGEIFDPSISSYVLNPSIKKYDPETLYGGNSAALMIGIREDHIRQIAENGLEKVFYDIESPLTETLYIMEENGFRINREALLKLGEQYSENIKVLQDQIFAAAGHEFNISSTRQLGQVLFEELGLPHGRKTKSGYSTDIEVLEGIEKHHPIVGQIIEFRQYSKLKNTYIDGLASSIDPEDGKIHTTFKQTAASTGRISSIEPNLQNIPVRQQTEIRSLFLPSDDSHVLIAADYSQIELRVLASISQDSHMCDAFRNGEDIHTRTASEVFGVSKEEVTSQMRSAAKAVNFGIVYGISDFGLAKNIGISRKQAGEYISRYLEEFSGVAGYMKDIVEKAREDGFVRTLTGRIRYIPELKSSNYNIRQMGERIAMNTPIQGTAADIIKVAMVNVEKKLEANQLKSKLIMQVHDELIIDALKSESEQVKDILRECMVTDEFLSDVPLLLHVSEGDNWGVLK